MPAKIKKKGNNKSSIYKNEVKSFVGASKHKG